jgi:hypothetical protein
MRQRCLGLAELPLSGLEDLGLDALVMQRII